MRRNRRNGLRRERILMIGASVFVLSALTMTGIYVKEKNKDKSDGYVVDFSKLESQQDLETPTQVAEQIKDNQYANSDMDIDPTYQEANSKDVIIPGVTDVGTERAVEKNANYQDSDLLTEEDDTQENTTEEVETASTSVKKSYTFSNEDFLKWPIVGNILINYSMDKTIYFPTLEQYKYNPSIIIEAVEGEPIVAAADGCVSSRFSNEEVGNGLILDIGNGYQLTYGQLKDITVKEGANVSCGDIIGYVSTPTKYFSVEGSNVYFKLTKDGTPVNLMSKLE